MHLERESNDGGFPTSPRGRASGGKARRLTHSRTGRPGVSNTAWNAAATRDDPDRHNHH
ncbi:hypothetical protein SORBI_3005G156450 [Sorghum bicolor]|uniref:Uncharacterized protein n=1 Tax=Sorghum bicolor TaxID=4558 RepID=A0A1Z5RIR9_SORBI|nr:hypothetical protein SORBI_3005G156450 [Sorghum bicolor]